MSPHAMQELEATAAKLEREIPAIGAKTERLTAELAKQEHVRPQPMPPLLCILHHTLDMLSVFITSNTFSDESWCTSC